MIEVVNLLIAFRKGKRMEEETKFHWSEGMKYVSEGLKALFLLNGAATISILNFIGNVKDPRSELINAMYFFALGAMTAPISFFLAYITQLQYGNAVRTTSKWSAAGRYHWCTYFIVFAGIIFFLLGIWFAGTGLRTAVLKP
jgi:hypothetical protein